MDNIVMEWIRWLLMAAAAILNALINFLAEKAKAEPAFVQGIVVALLAGLLIGTVARYVLFWRQQIQGFFRPPVHVMQSRGPTPAQSYRSCMAGVAKIGLFAVFVLIILIAMLTERFIS